MIGATTNTNPTIKASNIEWWSRTEMLGLSKARLCHLRKYNTSEILQAGVSTLKVLIVTGANLQD